jgi:D-3-phosphoglycerate dehydrogenase
MEQKQYKVLISDGLSKEGLAILSQYPNLKVDVHKKLPKEDLLKVIADYDAIIIRSATKLTKDVLLLAKNLKVICRAGTGYDNIDAEQATKQGIVVLITPTGNSNAVVELTMGLMLAFARKICLANQSMKEGKWEKAKFEGTELKDKTVGIIGLGRIGAGVAKRCKAFEMNVIAYDQYIPPKVAQDLGVELVGSLKDFLPRVDYMTIHLPLTDETKNLISKEQLALMKPNAIIVNVARGGVVDEQALYIALKENKIRGACVDVFGKEPACTTDTPFIGLENVIALPHLGASTEEAQIEVSKLAANAIVQALNSKAYIDAVNLPFRISAAMADAYRPFMLLGQALGRLVVQLNSARITGVEIRHRGKIFTNFDPIRTVILYAIFSNRLGENVSILNIEKTLQERSIPVECGEYYKAVNLSSFIKVYIQTEKGETKAAGTVFSDKPKITEVDGLYFDLEPAEHMLALMNNDKPGVIGKVGTLLGENGINIAGWQLGRHVKGQNALAIITMDDPITPEVMEKLKKLPEIIDAKAINL